MNRTSILAASAALAVLLLASPAPAAQLSQTFDFAIDRWFPLEAGDGPVTLHRIRLDLLEGRLTKSSLARPYNSEYLETVRIQLDYTNRATAKWSARVTVRWLDAEGRVIDGFSANEKLERNSARKVAQVTLSTLRYGLERAATLEVDIHYEP